jgi:hypothetical protein
MDLTLGERLSLPFVDPGGLFASCVWRQLAPHLPEWVAAQFDRSGSFLASISATGFLALWDVHSAFRGYDVLVPANWPKDELSPEEVAADPGLAEDASNAARIARDLGASSEKGAAAMRAARRRSALAWTHDSRFLFAAKGRRVLVIDVASQSVVATCR